jgi:hypothetical protein
MRRIITLRNVEGHSAILLGRKKNFSRCGGFPRWLSHVELRVAKEVWTSYKLRRGERILQ